MVIISNLGAGSQTLDALKEIEKGFGGKRAMFAVMSWGAALEITSSQRAEHRLIELVGKPPAIVNRAVQRLTGSDDWTR